jgi:hypothetical protein
MHKYMLFTGQKAEQQSQYSVFIGQKMSLIG